jgi:hypothetical protein
MANITPVPSPTDDTYVYKIDNQFYRFQVSLLTIHGSTTTLAQDIKPSAIKNLVIEDSLKDTFHKGYIIINNSYDVIERDFVAAPGPDSPQYYNSAGVPNPIDAGFRFRGESRDIIRIDIQPLLNENDFTDLGNESIKSVVKMMYDFVIYNSEEIPGSGPNEKFKKLYFWDLYYQILTEKNTPFSTSNYLPTQNVSTLDDTERGIPTGLAALALLLETFPNNDYPAGISYADSSGKTQTLNGNADTIIANYNSSSYQNLNWDVGGGNIFFSAPAKYKAINSLHYILDRHVSNQDSNYDQCVLRLERYPRAFSLKSMRQYFAQAYDISADTPGSHYLETIRIGGFDQDNAQDYVAHAFTPAGGVYLGRLGTIKTYSFDNIPGLYSQQELVSRFVHSYKYDDKQFNVDALSNSVEQAMEAYKASYVNPMISSNGNPPFPNFAPGQYRDKNINIDNVFSVVSDNVYNRLNAGRNRFLYASIMSNNIISFRVPGVTTRQAGRFIGIDRDGAMLSSKLDDKLLGIYFILEVKHIFSDAEYYNDIHCIKTYNFYQQSDTNSDGTISTGI